MFLWAFLIGNISKISMGILGALGLFLYGRNSKLACENDSIRQDLKTNEKIIDIQNKVIDVAKNTKATDFDGNLQRMRDGKL